jgi:hypothetical protein
MTEKTRVCPTCKQEKPLTHEFWFSYKDQRKGKGFLKNLYYQGPNPSNPSCKLCYYAYRKKLAKKDQKNNGPKESTKTNSK